MCVERFFERHHQQKWLFPWCTKYVCVHSYLMIGSMAGAKVLSVSLGWPTSKKAWIIMSVENLIVLNQLQIKYVVMMWQWQMDFLFYFFFAVISIGIRFSFDDVVNPQWRRQARSNSNGFRFTKKFEFVSAFSNSRRAYDLIGRFSYHVPRITCERFRSAFGKRMCGF